MTDTQTKTQATREAFKDSGDSRPGRELELELWVGQDRVCKHYTENQVER